MKNTGVTIRKVTRDFVSWISCDQPFSDNGHLLSFLMSKSDDLLDNSIALIEENCKIFQL